MITAFITGVVVAIPTSLITMKLLNSSLFISNTELKEANARISLIINCLLYTSPSPRDGLLSRMPSSA